MWDPATETFRFDASGSVPRTYHSSAVLLPDGRVFVGGGGFCGLMCKEEGVNHLSAEIFSPYYLFNADGSFAAKPDIFLGVNSARAIPSVFLYEKAMHVVELSRWSTVIQVCNSS